MTRDILASIAEYKTREVTLRRAAGSFAALETRAQLAEGPRGFLAALRRACKPGRPALIAEIKKASPSQGLIRESFHPAAIAKAYEAGGATCLSVLTDGPSFQGEGSDLTEAREASILPCLRKDFLIDPWQVTESRGLGADCILVILSLVDDSLANDLISEAGRLGMDVLVETHDEVQVDRAIRLGAPLIGINNRDLRTFSADLSVTRRLAQKIPPTALIVSESGIFTRADTRYVAQAGARAMLVGEALMRKADIGAATRALLADQ